MNGQTKDTPRTAYEKMRALHEVTRFDDGTSLLYIDRIILHERTGSIALTNMIEEGREVLCPDMVFATIDHIVDTRPGRPALSRMPGGEVFIDAMRTATHQLGLRLFDIDDPRQGIVHVMAPEQGVALPGLSIVCPDSHTCTLGGLGALAWGIGSTDCEHALATRTLRVASHRQMRIWVDGTMPPWLSAKDIIIHLIESHTTSGAKGYVIEFDGPAIRQMEIEQRLTLCNMAVEFGAFSAFVTPDAKTLDYVRGRPFAPTLSNQSAAQSHWLSLSSDAGATFDREIQLDIAQLSPRITWGTSPQQAIPIDGRIPAPARDASLTTARSDQRALDYMGLEFGETLLGKKIDVAFIGSCTNSRLSDLRRAAHILRARRVADHITAICVPGSTPVKQAAEAEGLHLIFQRAGFEWHEAGCAMCFFAGGHSFGEQARVISSTNRNFEGRQGPGTRTHIASPETVALSAINGCISDLRAMEPKQDTRQVS